MRLHDMRSQLAGTPHAAAHREWLFARDVTRCARPADKRKRRGASCVAALRGWQLNQVR